ncbi:MAG: polysaccharide pyruvyl transferase family protein [Lachnospiraceae bacterium]|nr:polysaccharide pyruvyl transferase family protein [Lachnospiraceae bacterium]
MVIFGTPNHGNLGDYAIFAAEKKLFQKMLPDSNVFGVNMTDFQHEIESLKNLLKSEDLLVLTGGGNLGNQYMDDEKIRRTVIQKFKNNRIVIFPQTMYFTEDIEGANELKKTSEIYNSHKDLWIVARDEHSYQEMKKVFTGEVRILPDVVLTWGKLERADKKGALLILRKDLEGVLDAEAKQWIKENLQATYETVEETDTEIDVPKRLEQLEIELQRKMEQINRAELVVTDRLHGMILAAIAQTPCIVLNNYNHKLKETYKWIEYLDYVVYVSDLSELPMAVNQLKKKISCEFRAEEIEEKYRMFLREIING